MIIILAGTERFNFKNKQAKPATESSRLMKENLQLKNEFLKLRKSLLLQETEAKSVIDKLTIENLKLTTYNI